MWSSKSKTEKLLIIFIIVATLVAIGAIIGCIVLATQHHQCKCQQISLDPYTGFLLSQNFSMQSTVRDYLMNNVDPEVIHNHLSNLTKEYHPAGTEANSRVHEYIVEAWRSYGLDQVEIDEYHVLLSYPDYDHPNTIHLQNGTIISKGVSEKRGPPEAQAQQYDEKAFIWWNAYAKSGNSSGKIVYVNHCTNKDFDFVVNNKSIDISGKIVLCRYGNGWRGSKVFEAEKRNAIGVILYTDPQDYGPPKRTYPSDFVYADSIYMPPTGAQRGSLSQINEDPETPLYPAKWYTYRWFNETVLREKMYLPTVPVMPISYGDATSIFEAMVGGEEVTNPLFKGTLNVTYYFTSDAIFVMNVSTNVTHRTIKNAVGYIWGKDEPDRYVLISNHFDAWTYGAQDPNSGTAVSLEMSRLMMSAINSTQWRPRRTIMFCAWDAEEYNLYGSTEWVEEKLKLLEARAVAVLNVDIAVMGNQSLYVEAMPLLYRTIMNAAKLVPNPNPDELAKNRKTVYDSWSFYSNLSLIPIGHLSFMPGDPSVPYMLDPGAGSDHASFMYYVGAPIINFGFHTPYYSGPYPLYHSMYEIEWTVSNLVDIHYVASAAMVKLWNEMVRSLADTLIIPFNVTDYGIMMKKYVENLNHTLYNEPDIDNVLDDFDQVMANLSDASERFLLKSHEFQDQIDLANSGSEISLITAEALNSRLTYLERCFIDPRGLPERPLIRHVVFAPSASNSYKGNVFAGVLDSLQQYKQSQNETWRKIVNMQLSVVHYSLESAIQLLDLPPNAELL